MEFCPTCGMLLQYEPAKSGQKSRFFCPTCPYIYSIHAKVRSWFGFRCQSPGVFPSSVFHLLVDPVVLCLPLCLMGVASAQIAKKQLLPKKKEMEPIFSWEEAMRSAPKTQVTCSRCQGGDAYFRQMQIRSADEPMTTFYMCCNVSCKYEWRED
ncbi:hypothetical protein Taro_043227 [Colocasia esculenta]|uniref:DNA-directed RNA polymerase subunit n=1 Tax=Colocasia esculenta TaxID=4460 RepID=A0A843X131_COLES|nr:hypothetical protein [Colocasia esculenta]